jgi:hypothetical protein
LIILTIAGGAAFWIATFVTSLLPIAAKYRAAFSNWSIQTVWVGSLFAGMMIGCCVSFILLHFFTKILTKKPILKSVMISSVALVISIILVAVPMISHAKLTEDAIHYFFVGVAFDTARFLFLGIVVGYLYKKRYYLK